MNSKETLEQIRNFKPYGYDNIYKEEYALDGTLNDYLQDELDIIKRDLERLERYEKIDEILNNTTLTEFKLPNGEVHRTDIGYVEEFWEQVKRWIDEK